MMNFIRFPWKVYSRDPHWVPPLIRDRKKTLDAKNNPFFKNNPAEFFLAYKDAEVVGRIAAILNRQHNKIHRDKTGFFGFLEAVNEITVFETLLDTAANWLRQYGCQMMLGPVNPSTNYEMGFLIDGFDSPPFFMLTYNPPYYPQRMETLGYSKARDFYSYYIDKESFILSDKLKRVRNAVSKRYPVTLRAGNVKDFQSELRIIGQIYNDAFANHWGFVPMTAEEFEFFANDLKMIIDPNLVLIAEYNGEAAGFLLGLPNINEVLKKIGNGRLFPVGLFRLLLTKNKIKGVRIITMGIKQQYSTFGLGSLFYEEIANRVIDGGYTQVEMSWVMEDNLLMNRAARLLGGKIYKTYRVYQKSL
jgi:hypothetical protein